MAQRQPAWKGPPLGLPLKLALYLVLSTVCFWALFGVLNLRLQRRQSERSILLDAERISEIIQRSTRHQMLRNDRPALAEMITDIGTQPGIRLVRVFNKEGRISYSSTASEVGTMVDQARRAVLRLPCAERAAGETEPAGPRAHLRRSEWRPRARHHTPRRESAGLLERVLPRAPARKEDPGGHRHAAFPGHRGPADGRAGAAVAGLHGARGGAGFSRHAAVRLAGGAAAHPRVDGGHAQGVERRPGLPHPGAVERRTGSVGRVLQQDDARSRGGQHRGPRLGAHARRARAAQIARARARLLVAGGQREDGLARQTGRHRGARDQQSTLRHADLRASDVEGARGDRHRARRKKKR